MMTLAPSGPNWRSSGLSILSISNLYWNPEHPPPSTTTLKKDPSWHIFWSCLTHESLSFRWGLTASARTFGVVDKNIPVVDKDIPESCCEILIKELKIWIEAPLTFTKLLTSSLTLEKHCKPSSRTHLSWMNFEKISQRKRKIFLCQTVWRKTADCQSGLDTFAFKGDEKKVGKNRWMKRCRSKGVGWGL